MEDNKGTVCVTGGTGFIASWLIMRLLEHGYSVRTTIRPDPDGRRDISFLKNLPGASERLQILTADLSDPESFSPAIDGCVGVFHVATPVDFENREPEPVVTKRSIDGALGILRTCLNSKTVKRVVYTSSAAAAQLNNSGADILDEDTWSDVESIRQMTKFGASYGISKTLTEKAVLEFGEQHGLEVVTVVPTFVHGPFICPKFAGSVRTSLALILGNVINENISHDQHKSWDENEYPILLEVSFVHVDDLARAHIFLFEHSDAKGRYICSSATMTIEEMSKFLSERYPEFQIPSPESLKEVKGPRFTRLSSRKLLDAGFEYKYGIEDMFDGAIQCCKEKGYL
ncbi:vestitone reductase-like isoform X1 [Eucalyptus grandis]|uniref:vestitone reductase-like isoform X1 n=1 Tax=Eucalyptus grandis TaxID=71139 RepID=UPI00192EE414|nr:vestitone reductase-like isoform X1 [Eucalyptus grandis]